MPSTPRHSQGRPFSETLADRRYVVKAATVFPFPFPFPFPFSFSFIFAPGPRAMNCPRCITR